MIEVMAYQCEATGDVFATKVEAWASEVMTATASLSWPRHEGVVTLGNPLTKAEALRLMETSGAAYRKHFTGDGSWLR